MEASQREPRILGYVVTWGASTVTALVLQCYGAALQRSADPPTARLAFHPIHEDAAGNLRVLVENYGTGHTALLKMRFCPEGKWSAYDPAAETQIDSWEALNRNELHGLPWEERELIALCREPETLRVLGHRDINRDSSDEFTFDAPAEWILRTGIDRGAYAAGGLCALTLFATERLATSKVVPCVPRATREEKH